MAKSKILLISGHGEGDPGACSRWGQEQKYTRELAALIQKAAGSHLDITMYPQEKNCYNQSRNGNSPDYKSYDFVLEIHFNAKTAKDENGDGKFTGTGGYYHPENAGRFLAGSIVSHIADLGFKIWGNFTSTGLLNLNRAQAAGTKYFLLETAFIDDGDDMKWYAANKAKVAEAIAQAFITGLGGSGSAETPDIPQEEIYRVRKSWKVEKSQLFAGTLGGAKAACPSGYSVYNAVGKCVYNNQEDGTQAVRLFHMTESQFVETLGPLCRRDQKKTGILACVTAAQAVLESGYGKTDLAQKTNNLFGMKCILSGNTWPGSTWDGKSYYGTYSPEQDQAGREELCFANFRQYQSLEDSIEDHSAYLLGAARDGGTRRYDGLAGEGDYRKAFCIIKEGGYATDQNYVAKLSAIVQKWDLERFNINAIEQGSDEKENWILRLQAELNAQGCRDVNGDKLEADNIAGVLTLSACPAVGIGARGGITKLIQERLGERFRIGVTGGYDGIFGRGTRAAVMELQKQSGLGIDGIVGPRTWPVLVR